MEFDIVFQYDLPQANIMVSSGTHDTAWIDFSLLSWYIQESGSENKEGKTFS